MEGAEWHVRSPFWEFSRKLCRVKKKKRSYIYSDKYDHCIEFVYMQLLYYIIFS